MKIIVFSRLMAERQVLSDKERNKKIAGISIYSSGDQPASLSYCDTMLSLNFDDVSVTDIPGTVPFSMNHVEKILDFMEKHQDADFLIIHCDAGVSRSPAVAIAIAEIYNDDRTFYRKYPLHNKMIYSKIIIGFQKRKFFKDLNSVQPIPGDILDPLFKNINSRISK